MTLPIEESMAHAVEKFSLEVWDIRHVLEVLDAIPLKSFALSRYIESRGLNPDHAMLWREEDSIGKEIRLIRENLLDDFIVFTFNTFEFSFISRPELMQLTQKERHFFMECDEARSELYKTIQLNPELAGRFLRYQRIGTTVFLITPKS